MSISQTKLEYEDFKRNSHGCNLSTVLLKAQWICRENRFPNLQKNFIFSLMLPLDNATCERGFSLLNNIKTKKRNRLGEHILFSLMLLGAAYAEKFIFDYPSLSHKIASTWSN